MEPRARRREVEDPAPEREVQAPVVVGDTLTFRPSVTSVTDKKGGAMTLIVVDTPVTNQNGVHVADVSRTIVVRNARPS